MAVAVIMPRQGNTVESCVISEWHKQVGDTVAVGDILFSYETDGQYLGAVLLEHGLIQGEQGPYGLMISSVNGETADWNADQSYWALYIGEEYATTGVDTTPVTDGGEYRLVYTIG